MKATDKYLHIDGIVTAFTTTTDSDYYFNGESHNFWEMVYVSDGKAGVSADDKIYNLSAGDIIFHKPYEFHRIWSSENTKPTYSVISFYLSGFGTKHLENLTLRADEKQTEIMHQLDAYMHSNPLNPDQMLDYSGIDEPNYSCFVFLLEFLLCTMVSSENPIKEFQSENAVIFKKVVGYMENNLDASMTVDDFAAFANVSAATLKRIFKEYSSHGVHNYFVQLKMRKAKDLLRKGMPVCDVAKETGFCNQNYFSATFKRTVGCPPSKY